MATRRDVFNRLIGGIVAASTLAALAGSASAQNAADILNYKGADREAKLIEGAKKEGEVVFYSGMIVNQALRPIADAFMAKYPFVKVTYWRGDSEDVLVKLTAEMGSNNVIADLIEGSGIAEQAVQANFVQPFYSPLLADYPEQYRDPAQLWAPTRVSYFGVAYNTDLVPADKIPSSYDDLLDPYWKGKMAWPGNAITGAPIMLVNLITSWGKEKADDYLKKLAGQDITNFGSGSARTLVDQVIAGEFPMALAIYAHHPLISAAKGAPVGAAIFEPVYSAAGTVLATKNLKHPHAAMLFIDYLLSKEGQTILAQAEYFPARPDVEPLPSISAASPRTKGLKENFITPAAMQSNIAAANAILQEVFRK